MSPPKGGPAAIKKIFADFSGDNQELAVALADFLTMRKTIKKPIVTPQAAHRILNRLKEYPSEQWVTILDQSTDHCWQDIYAPKTFNSPAVQESMPLPKSIIRRE